MGVKLAAASGGSIELVPTDTASTFTATIPARTGNMMVDGPAFSAYQSSVQALAANTYTKIQFQTESYDTANAYDNATNYRFTPLVAGYYQVNASLAAGSIVTNVSVNIYKNGSVAFYGSNPVCGSNTTSALVYLNGSTDYIEIYGTFVAAQNTYNNANFTYFQAFLARGA
jgi:hypothetical protein